MRLKLGPLPLLFGLPAVVAGVAILVLTTYRWQGVELPLFFAVALATATAAAVALFAQRRLIASGVLLASVVILFAASILNDYIVHAPPGRGVHRHTM